MSKSPAHKEIVILCGSFGGINAAILSELGFAIIIFVDRTPYSY